MGEMRYAEKIFAGKRWRRKLTRMRG